MRFYGEQVTLNNAPIEWVTRPPRVIGEDAIITSGGMRLLVRLLREDKTRETYLVTVGRYIRSMGLWRLK